MTSAPDDGTGGGTGGGGLRRDEVTLAGYTVLASWAWFLYGLGAVLPLLRVEQETSRTVMGMHSLALAGGGLLAGVTTVAVVRRLRRRGAFVLGAALAGVGVVALTLGPSPVWTVAATFVTGTGGSMILNMAVPSLSDHHGRDGAAALSEGNAVAAGVGLIAPLAIGATVGLGWSWRPATLVLVPLMVLVVLVVRRVPAGVAALDAGLPPRGGRKRPLPPVFWAYVMMLMTCVAVEFSCVAWSADLLRQRTGLSPAAASVGVTAVVAGMAVGRWGVGRLALLVAPRRLMAAAIGVAVGGWLVVWLSTHPAAALAGLVLTGLGIAGHYPLGAAMLLGAVPGQTDQATGWMSLSIAVAAGAAPFALGAVADATSTHTAFLSVPLLLIVATGALLTAVRFTRADARAYGAGPVRRS